MKTVSILALVSLSALFGFSYFKKALPQANSTEPELDLAPQQKSPLQENERATYNSAVGLKVGLGEILSDSQAS